MNKEEPDFVPEEPDRPWLRMPGIVQVMLGFLCTGGIMGIIWCFPSPRVPTCIGTLILLLFCAVRPFIVIALALYLRTETLVTLKWRWFGVGVTTFLLSAIASIAFNRWVLTYHLLEGKIPL